MRRIFALCTAMLSLAGGIAGCAKESLAPSGQSQLPSQLPLVTAMPLAPHEQNVDVLRYGEFLYEAGSVLDELLGSCEWDERVIGEEGDKRAPLLVLQCVGDYDTFEKLYAEAGKYYSREVLQGELRARHFAVVDGELGAIDARLGSLYVAQGSEISFASKAGDTLTIEVSVVNDYSDVKTYTYVLDLSDENAPVITDIITETGLSYTKYRLENIRPVQDRTIADYKHTMKRLYPYESNSPKLEEDVYAQLDKLARYRNLLEDACETLDEMLADDEGSDTIIGELYDPVASLEAPAVPITQYSGECDTFEKLYAKLKGFYNEETLEAELRPRGYVAVEGKLGRIEASGENTFTLAYFEATDPEFKLVSEADGKATLSVPMTNDFEVTVNYTYILDISKGESPLIIDIITHDGSRLKDAAPISVRAVHGKTRADYDF